MEEDNHFVAHPEGGITTASQVEAEKAKADDATGNKDQATIDAEAQVKKEAEEKAAAELADLQAKADEAATAASDARTKADELKATITDASTDEEKAAAETAEQTAVEAETAAQEAKAAVEAASKE